MRSLNAIKLRKAPKGRIGIAQANGLGIEDKSILSPERADYMPVTFFNAPFQGLDRVLCNFPRALPWAVT
jgi:hypothetical protein